MFSKMKTMIDVAEKCQARLVFHREEKEINSTLLGTRQSSPDMLKGAGFNLFVTPEFALKFKYAASIYNLAQNIGAVYPTRCLVVDATEDPKSRWGHKFTGGGRSSPLYFRGELPLWVANKIRLAIGMGVRDITIHSNDKRIEENIVLGDPVIVGWVGFSHHSDWLIKNKGKMPRWYFSWGDGWQPKNPFGFVIAIFGDGETI